MKTIAGVATALALTGLLAAPADAAWRGHYGGRGYYHHHGWGGARYYAPGYYGGYGYGYPAYGYGYGYDYDPGAAIALSAIGTIAGLMAHDAFRHARHYRHHRHR
jgi:hypothetical protein